MFASRAGTDPQFFLMGAAQREVLTPQQPSPGTPAVRKENVFQEGHLVWRYHSASTSPITRAFHFKLCFCLNFYASSSGLNLKNSTAIQVHWRITCRKKLVGIVHGILIPICLIMKAAERSCQGGLWQSCSQ